MNNKIINSCPPHFSARLVAAMLLLIAGLSLAACLPATPASETTATLLPTPLAEVEPETLSAAYPPPGAAYPSPIETPADIASAAYPAAPAISPTGNSPVAATSDDPGAAAGDEVYAPWIGAEQPAPAVTATATLPAATVTPATNEAAALGALPTPISVVDFAAVSRELAARSKQLAFNKIGFHVTFLEESDELDPYMARLDSEGVPFFLKSVDNAEPLYKAQELMKQSGVPHTLVYRSTAYDVPDYSMEPIAAAEMYWELEKAGWPPELDPGLIWFETMNELDKTRSEWLAQFSLRTAQLALRDGYKWAAFGWASGEPEPDDWESPAMLDLLRLIAANPDRLAIALHEYSYTIDDIGHEYPYKIGRFMELFRVADAHGIPRPTVLITEWGWTYDLIPPEPIAMEDVAWAASLYGAFPEVLGAAIWNLGYVDGQFLELNTQVQGLIDNMMAISLDTTFSAPVPPERTPLDAGLFPPPER